MPRTTRTPLGKLKVPEIIDPQTSGLVEFAETTMKASGSGTPVLAAGEVFTAMKSARGASRKSSVAEGEEKPSVAVETMEPDRASSRNSANHSRASSSRKQEVELLLRKLEEEKNVEQAYIEKKYALLSQVVEQDGDNSSVHSQESHTNIGVRRQQFPEFVQFPEVAQRTQPQAELRKFVEHVNPTQAAARQAISRELPKFDGKPEDWPLFFASYNRTTAMCGFTAEENLVRLQNCLSGKALEAVRCLLMHPSNIQRILDVLKMLFGQPERIIHQLTTKIASLPAPNEERLETLVNFAIAVQNYCAMLQACDIPEYLYNVSLLQQLVDKLPPTVKLNWAQQRATLDTVNLGTFGSWLFSMAEAVSAVVHEPSAEAFTGHQSNNRRSRHLNTHTVPSSIHANGQNTDPSKRCFACNKNCRSLCECNTFKQLRRHERWDVVQRNALCRSCLGIRKSPPHACCNPQPCGKNGCIRRHHPLLHNEQQTSASIASHNTSGPSSSGANNTHLSSESVLLKYVPITVYGVGKKVDTFALLDEGSEMTLVDQSLVDELELQGTPSMLRMKWSDGTIRTEPKSQMVNVQIAAGSRRFTINDVRTVANMALSPQSMDIRHLSGKYQHLQGLPLLSYQNAIPRMLIGSSHPHLAVALKLKEGRLGDPMAVKTRLGWTVYGPIGGSGSRASYQASLNIHRHDDNIDAGMDQAMMQYFAMENVGVSATGRSFMSTDDERAIAILKNRTCFNGQRYETGLLWRFDEVHLPSNSEMALRRHRSLERRMKKDPELMRVLKQKIAEYHQKGYIRELSDLEKAEVKWYLPIFPVVNPNKPGKVRIVWDAAAMTPQGISLNSVLLKGPDLVTPLFNILLRFRIHRIGIAGDIREMFHQVGIIKEDQNYQCFFWTRDDGQLVVYTMAVMTFGACCSPCTAQFIKNLNADRYQASHPEAWAAIVKSHYVDDLLISVDSEEDANRLIEEVRMIHAAGGFEIRNWISNSEAVMAALGKSIPTEKDIDLTPEPSVEKVLGMWWNLQTDTFNFKISWKRFDDELLMGRRYPTKRELLRVLMTIYDPLGIIAHFLSFLKAVLQDVWRSGIGWDEEVQPAEFEKWKRWLGILPQVEDVQIQRCYSPNSPFTDADDIQLHTFVDAGINGMAAAIYLRIVVDSAVQISLLAAKTKVAPLKLTSVPRLELQAALIGTRLSRTIIEVLQLKLSARVFWTDSRDVLCWINSDQRRYSQFVGFRITEMLETTNRNEWRYVPSKLNVADDATKWQSTPDLSTTSRWFNGPEFLYGSEELWPIQPQTVITDAERTAKVLAHLTSHESVINAGNHSDWKKLTVMVGWVLRFIHNARKKTPSRKGPLSRIELFGAETFLIKQAQLEGYPAEYNSLSSNAKYAKGSFARLAKTSTIYKLLPWVDKYGVMRMRTRIGACDYATEEAKNPVILPNDHPVTNLIISYFHQKYHHKNVETVINELRQRYQISHLRSQFNAVRNRCQACKNEKVQPQPPMMSDLPAGRLTAFSAPFSHTGVDYFGPLEVVVGRSSQKRWIMLATCLTTRAIHMEKVHSLTTNSCIMAIRNFINRRGRPRKFYSDRGTNFIGAQRELIRLEEHVNQNAVATEFIDTETDWVFNPPLTPHMGGSWERLIRSVKTHLTTVYTAKRLTDEVLTNLLAEVENVVNSRPLTHVPVDDDSSPALTPNHFLLGSSNGIKPLATIDDSGKALKQNWSTSQILVNRFWQRWVSDYLPEITRRSKWFEKPKPIAINDVVIIVDPRLPRNSWPKGRVVATKVGKDGQVRVATVRTASGATYERPAVKLAVLDVLNNRK